MVFISIVTDTCFLSKSPSDLARLIFFDSAIRFPFDSIYPLGFYHLCAFWNSGDFGEYPIFLQPGPLFGSSFCQPSGLWRGPVVGEVMYMAGSWPSAGLPGYEG